MAVSCAICGEELLGSVNRCWKCGNFVTSHPGDATLPPVRTGLGPEVPMIHAPDQAPIPTTGAKSNAGVASPLHEETGNGETGEETLNAEIVGGEDVQQGNEADANTEDSTNQGELNSAANLDALAAGSRTGEAAESVLLAGSDGTNEDVRLASFGRQQEIHFPGDPMTESPPDVKRSQENLNTPKLAEPIATTRTYVPPVKPAYTNSSLSTAGAFSSLFLGIIALIAAKFTIASLFPAVLGIAMGIWGIFSNQRTIALVGLAFCVLAFGAGLFGVAIWIFRLMYGISPFDEGVIEIPT